MFKTYEYYDIDAIILELRNNKAGIVETDTIMGIISLNQSVIYKIKKRHFYKKIIKFIPDITYLPELTEIQKKFIDTFLPGGVTIIIDKVSYRIPNDKFLLTLMSYTGPLYCSSANISNRQPINSIDQAYEHFGNKLYFNLFLINYKCNNKTNQPSTVINLDNFKIIRQGYNVNKINEFLINHNLLNNE